MATSEPHIRQHTHKLFVLRASHRMRSYYITISHKPARQITSPRTMYYIITTSYFPVPITQTPFALRTCTLTHLSHNSTHAHTTHTVCSSALTPYVPLGAHTSVQLFSIQPGSRYLRPRYRKLSYLRWHQLSVTVTSAPGVRVVSVCRLWECGR